MDLYFILFNIIIFVQFFAIIFVGDEEEFYEYKANTMTLRFLIVCGLLFQALKLGYFLRLID